MTDTTAERIKAFIEPLRVPPGSKVNLPKDFDPRYRSGIRKKAEGVELLREGVELLADRQRERQAVGNDILAPALEDMERTDLRGRLHALADAAEALA